MGYSKGKIATNDETGEGSMFDSVFHRVCNSSRLLCEDVIFNFFSFERDFGIFLGLFSVIFPAI